MSDLAALCVIGALDMVKGWHGSHTNDVEHALHLAQRKADESGRPYGIFSYGKGRVSIRPGSRRQLRHALEVCLPRKPKAPEPPPVRQVWGLS